MTSKGTYIFIGNIESPRKLANKVIKALDLLDGWPGSNGTIRNPDGTASITLSDGRTLIQTVYEDGLLDYRDDAIVIDLDDQFLYVDWIGRSLAENKLDKPYSYVLDKVTTEICKAMENIE